MLKNNLNALRRKLINFELKYKILKKLFNLKLAFSFCLKKLYAKLRLPPYIDRLGIFFEIILIYKKLYKKKILQINLIIEFK